MDDILGKTPAINPVGIASSSRINLLTAGEDDGAHISDDDLAKTSPQKKKIKTKASAADNCVQILKDIQTNKEQQHKEVINLMRQGQEDFKNIMAKLIEKL